MKGLVETMNRAGREQGQGKREKGKGSYQRPKVKKLAAAAQTATRWGIFRLCCTVGRGGFVQLQGRTNISCTTGLTYYCCPKNDEHKRKRRLGGKDSNNDDDKDGDGVVQYTERRGGVGGGGEVR